ncbi:MAG: LytR C-terminal domain-containing protein [Anaerolineales bacterium]|nr:LytR C-terminal domain-containing protein [Anaerolineales bacterium]
MLLPDQAALQGLVTQALTASAAAAVNEAITVEIQNGTLNDGWDALAASRLNYAGYAARLAPADRRDYAATILVDLSAAQDYNRSALLLNALGLMPNRLVSLPDPNSPVQYRLILGADYQPCFQPEALSP